MTTKANDEKLDELVARLNGAERVSGWHQTLALGRLLIQEKFGHLESCADLLLADAKKTIREIAKRPGIQFSSTTIYNSLVCTILLDRLEGEGVPVRENLSPSHLRHLGNLPLDVQVGLARRAILHGWRSGRLEAEARNARRRNGQRPRVPTYEKDLKRVERWARAPVFEELDDLDRLELDELDDLAARLGSAEHLLGQQISRLRRAVKKRGGKLRKLPKCRRPRRKAATNTSFAEIIREVGQGISSPSAA